MFAAAGWAAGAERILINRPRPGAAAIQIAGTALNAVAPGTFAYRADNNSGCGGYYAQGRIDPPVFLTFANIKSGTRITCIENGTSRITISVVG